MKKISLNAINLDPERIKDIKEKTINIKQDVLKILVGYYHYQFAYYNLNSKIDKAIIYYKGRYHEDLNYEERTILALYFIFSDDNTFLKELTKTDKEFKSICKKYNISKYFVKLRYKILMKLLKYEKDQKKLAHTK